MKLDIIKDNTDPFARYTMPKLTLNIEGKSTNTRTILTNLSSISLALKRPLPLLLKYIGYEKGTKTEIKHDKCILRGNFSNDDIQDVIYKFIKELVLCDSCSNPETYYVFENLGKVEVCIKCYACGFGSRMCVSRRVYNLIEKELQVGSNKNYGLENNNDASKSNDELNNENELGLDGHESKCSDGLMGVVSKVSACSDLNKLSGMVENDNVKLVLGGLELNVVKKGELNRIVEYVRYLIDNKIVKKLDCFRYFQVKSKYVEKDDSQKIRNYMSDFFKQ